jgi:hypothetical protein
MGNRHVAHNGSGYADPTVDAVIRNEYKNELKTKEDNKYRNMSNTIKRILENNGYELEGPISLINMANGRKRRIY